MTAQQLRKLNADLFEAELWLIEAESELQVLTDRSADVRRMLGDREHEVAQLKEKAVNQKRLAAQLLKVFMASKNDMEKRATHEDDKIREEAEAEKAIVEEYCANEETTPEILDAEIESTGHRIELLHEGNPHAIQQYEDRQRQIDRLSQILDNFQGDLQTLNDRITEIRGQWEPQLDALVSEISEAFSHNFERIGCAGQVGVYKDEDDFSLWAIQIKVKFR